MDELSSYNQILTWLFECANSLYSFLEQYLFFRILISTIFLYFIVKFYMRVRSDNGSD